MRRRMLPCVAVPLAVVAAGVILAYLADAPRRARYERYSLVHEGMTRDEVVAILGTKDSVALTSRWEVRLLWGEWPTPEFGVVISRRSNCVQSVEYYPGKNPVWDHVNRVRTWLGL